MPKGICTVSNDLKAEFRKAQVLADKGNYPSAFGVLERAVAKHFGQACLCWNCGGPNREDGGYCKPCSEAREKKLKDLGWKT